MSGPTPNYRLREPRLDSRTEWNEIGNAHRATLNILEDFAAEKYELENGQRATLNILEDFDAEKRRMAGAERAVLNILEDFAAEKSQLEEFQHSFLNILEDFSQEKNQLEGTQRAVLNILEDFEGEKANVELVNERLQNEIMDRKRIETEMHRTNVELSAANKELEAFSYSVSHDLRTPLRSIDGFSQALLEDCADKLDATANDYLHRVRSAAQRMATLIDDMLNLSRVTRCEMRRDSLDLSAIAKSIASELQEAEPDRRVEFTIEDGLTAVADPQLIRVAMENLIRNSWKYTSGHPTARIEFGRSDANVKDCFFVGDDGAGFDPRYAARLFGAFQRLHTAKEFPGTGVGLATVHRIIHRHGGEIWAVGAVEKGATFYFTLR
jgi:signal transduction histidine kinase